VTTALRPFLPLAAALLAATAQAQVGLARIDVAGTPVALVYPTAQAGTPQTFGPITLTVAPDAAPLPGRRRLVVLSHGTGGSPWSDHEMAASLVRAGFVVAQPTHQGDNFQDTSKAGPEAWTQRPQEITRTLDALAAHPQWGPALQLDRVGVHGMSAGGGTALVMAGARWRTLDLVRHCQAHGDDDLGFCYNGLADAQAQAKRRASYESARGVPELFLPAAVTQWRGGREGDDPRPDARVAAVSVAVPTAAHMSADSLARIRIPVGVVSAGKDQNLLPRWHSDRVMSNVSTATLLQALPQAGHFDLLGPWPAPLAQRVGATQPRGGMPEPGFDAADRAQAFQQVADFFQRSL
jgi:predicted dienelactone hydrolase